MFNRVADSDLTTAARIRDAAIEIFGDQGFHVGVRAIAAAAGVSPGLVNHHFGSKDGLRAACDDHVRQLIWDEKVKAVNTPDVKQGLLTAMAEIEEYGPLVAYMLRSLREGGPLAQALFEHLVADTERLLEAGVEAGTLKPSRDPAARARYLTTLNVGAAVLYMQLHWKHGEKINYRQAIRDMTAELTPPALEFYAQGLYIDPSIMDVFTEED